MIRSFEERTAEDGSLELLTTHDTSVAAPLALRGLRGSEAARVGAKLLLELVDRARDQGTLIESGEVWELPLLGMRVSLSAKRERRGGLFGFMKQAASDVVELTDVGAKDAVKAIACALTAHGLVELHSAPLVAREALEWSIELYPGDPSRPDDVEAPLSNHNNHLSYLALSRIAEDEDDFDRADEMFGAGLRRSWSAQMRTAGGRLEKIECDDVPSELVIEQLSEMSRGMLALYDDLKRRVPHREETALVPSPIFTFGGRGLAMQQILLVPEEWATLFYEGPARHTAADPTTAALVGEALATHRRDVTPLVRVTRFHPLFDSARQVEELETPIEYFPPFQLWTSLLASVTAWTVAGLDSREIRALLRLDRHDELRRAANEKWLAHVDTLSESAEAMLARAGQALH
ncbi:MULTISPECIES: hypothetical protein [Sandaracinus]|uniref:hypothetical protein n=1 Tax=Sandaracinus TaxID=1055688 RepID=UPI0019D4B579|nr:MULTISPECIES: hypothetical protein [Sandaracinus]QRN75768.1 Hypothetical protein MSR10575_88550 [Sandaracinus sp.]UJR87273.1 Hypothetical protein I5071_650 [Sandaracinus amylolyticus]